MENWCKFLGLYISEGYCYRGDQIRIYQNHNNTKDTYIKNILKSLPFKFSKYKRGWIVYGKDLYNFLKPLGLSGDKFIPENIKNLNTKNLKYLLDSLIFGDGTKDKNGRFKYYTISKKLADDVQEIAYKCGYYSTIYTVKNNYTPLGKKINHPIYHVHINNSKKRGGREFIRIKNLIKNNRIKNLKYRGKVYDITTKNHTLWVKRNNTCIWSSNSYYENHNPNKEFSKYLKEDVKIYNVSPNSNINCFEKISYEQMFKLLNNITINQNDLRNQIRSILCTL
jgi:hypothetical protein